MSWNLVLHCYTGLEVSVTLGLCWCGCLWTLLRLDWVSLTPCLGWRCVLHLVARWVRVSCVICLGCKRAMRWGFLSVAILELEVGVTRRLLVGLSVVVDLLGLEVGRSVGRLDVVDNLLGQEVGAALDY